MWDPFASNELNQWWESTEHMHGFVNALRQTCGLAPIPFYAEGGKNASRCRCAVVGKLCGHHRQLQRLRDARASARGAT